MEVGDIFFANCKKYIFLKTCDNGFVYGKTTDDKEIKYIEKMIDEGIKNIGYPLSPSCLQFKTDCEEMLIYKFLKNDVSQSFSESLQKKLKKEKYLERHLQRDAKVIVNKFVKRIKNKQTITKVEYLYIKNYYDKSIKTIRPSGIDWDNCRSIISLKYLIEKELWDDLRWLFQKLWF